MDMTPRQILKLTHQAAAPDRGRSLLSTMACSSDAKRGETRRYMFVHMMANYANTLIVLKLKLYNSSLSHGTVVRLVTSSACEVTTLLRYTNVFIIIIIITDADVLFCLYVCLSDREHISMHISMHVVSGRGLIIL